LRVEPQSVQAALDLQAVLAGMEGAKQLIQSVMEELRKERESGSADGK